MKNTSICFNNIEIIEWYDGVVRAIGKNRLKSYLIVLIEWDTKNSKKLFALFELDDSNLKQLKDCFESVSEKTKEEKWSEFEVIFHNIIKSYKRLPFFLSGEPKINEEYKTEIGEYDNYLPKLQSYDIENVLI